MPPSGRPSWTPIILHMEDNRPRSLAALTISDVLLVNPVRDGLNLVAKEGPHLNTVDGVLVLVPRGRRLERAVRGRRGGQSLRRGRARPTHSHLALSMPAAERAERSTTLQRLIRSRTAADWLDDQLAAARSSN